MSAALNTATAELNTIPMDFPADYASGNVKTAMQGISSGDAWKVPLDQLHVIPGLNVRTKNEAYTAHVESIARSMMAEGWYPDKPLGVFIDSENRICIRDGHSRYEAALLAVSRGAQINTAPCMTALRGTNMVDITVGLVKSNTGRPLLPIEVAVVCKRLVNWGWEIPAIAERLDYTERYINELLGLLEAPAALVELVSAGKVSASTAMKAVKTQGAVKAAEAIVKASKESKSGRVTDKTLAPPKPAKKAAPKAPKGVTPADPVAACVAAFNDPNFSKLSDAVQCLILAVAAP